MYISFMLPLAISLALLSGIVPFLLKRTGEMAKYCGFFLLGLSGALALGAGLTELFLHQFLSWQIATTFPGITLHFYLDALAALFLCIVGLIVLMVAFYAPGYLHDSEKHHKFFDMSFFTGIFVAAMYVVVVAHDVLSFMFAWEMMSLASYFLVVYNHDQEENRQAAFVYLLMAHLSGALILTAYGLLIYFGGNADFASFVTTHLSAAATTLIFLVAFVGFGLKAGIVPLHVWLPRAHPIAPSHISALMSGVMLKVAVYGFLRFCFYFLSGIGWQNGVVVLVVGTASALLGVLYALMQHDLKKLLAYHSVENMGIIFMGIGLALIFADTGHPLLAAIGLAAALYHCINHAIFKSLLFLGAGAILKASGEHDLDMMGGLIHKMPRTAVYFLIGCLAISALPPFNGFVSEWLTLQAAVHSVVLTGAALRITIAIAAALLALTGALAAACFVKVYGVAFLGKARQEKILQAKDPAFGMRFAMGFLALLCLVFGILPVVVLHVLAPIIEQSLHVTITSYANWLWLAPLGETQSSSYSPILIFMAVLLLLPLCYLVIRWCYGKARVSKGRPWDCGFGALNARMQYTGTAFVMPIRRVFAGVWPVTEKVELEPGFGRYHLQVGDWIWRFGYETIGQFLTLLARLVGYLQGGKVRIYLGYIFVTLIFLLWMVA